MTDPFGLLTAIATMTDSARATLMRLDDDPGGWRAPLQRDHDRRDQLVEHIAGISTTVDALLSLVEGWTDANELQARHNEDFVELADLRREITVRRASAVRRRGPGGIDL